MTYSPRKPIYLSTFGTLSIGEGADASTRSRRALALLALAAAGGPNGADREGIVSLLWPDSDADRAANSFRQILHGIRRDLGDGTIVYEGGSLKLNPSVVSVDLWDFEHAVRCDDMQAVARLYRGPFLGSFHIHGLVEFERWVEAQRERYRQVALTMLRRLATQASAEGSHQDAVRHWRSVVEIDPLSSKNALGLLSALADAGDRAGALDFARAYEALVRAELETEPDENVSDFVALLRRGSGDHGAVSTPTHARIVNAGNAASTSRAHTPTRALPPVAEDPPPPEMPDSLETTGVVYAESLYRERHTHEEPTVATRGRVSWRALVSGGRKRRLTAIAGAVILFSAAATAKRLSGAATAAVAVTSNVVAVIPFHTYDPADSALGTSLAAMLTADLDGAGKLRSIPTPSVTTTLDGMSRDGTMPLDLATAQRAAKKLGAGIIVTGEMVRHGSGVRLSMALHDARSGDAIGDQVIVDAEGDDVLRVIDDVTGQLVAERCRRPNEHLARAALRSTRSVAAVKSYLRGEAALRDGRYVDAVDEFERATEADTAFALGYYRLAVAADWSGRPALSRWGTEFALRYSDHLDDRDRRLVAAYAAFGDGHGTSAEHTYRSILDDYPDDAEAWFQLGEVLFHNNPLRGESATEARPAFERLLALDPDNLEAMIHLARIASLQQRQAVADALERRALQLADAPHTLEQRAFRAFALADRPGVRRVTRDLERAAPAKFGTATLLGVAIDADDVFGTERFARAVIDESLSPTSRAFGLRLLAHTSLAQGRWKEARAEIDSAMTLDPELAIGQLSLVATMPFVPLERAEIEHIRDMVRDWKPAGDSTSDDDSVRDEMFELIRLHRLGVLSVRLGDVESARRAAAVLETYTSPARTRQYAYTLAQSIRARISAEQGHLTEALAALDAADWEAPANVFAAEAADRFFRATLLQALGRTREAAKWYSSIAERAAYELPYLAPAQLRLAGIAQANGDTRAAKAHSDRVAKLWRRADTAVRVAFR